MDICGMFSIKSSIFQAESLYIKNIVLHGNATNELTVTTTMTEKTKRSKTKSLKVQHTSQQVSLPSLHGYHFIYLRSSLASLMAIVATLILPEILMQRLKYTVALKAKTTFLQIMMIYTITETNLAICTKLTLIYSHLTQVPQPPILKSISSKEKVP